MKAILFTLFTLFSGLLVAQENSSRTLFTGSKPLAADAVQTKATTCGVDTILYPYLKEQMFTAPNDSFFVDAMVGNVRTAAQAYHLQDSIRIHGVQFWGGAYSTGTAPQTLPVLAYLYRVDAANRPDSVLDSATVVITGVYDFYEAIFNTPYVYGQNFAVGVRSIPSDTLAVMTNNAGNVWSPNYGEGLAWRRFGSGTWNSALSFFGQDLEYMIFPIVSYDIDATFSTAAQNCEEDTVDFTLSASPILSNRMFNLHAFNDYWQAGSTDETYTWDFGDGSSVLNEPTGSHVYADSGTYTMSLTAEMLGYFSTCSTTFEETIVVNSNPDPTVIIGGATTFCEGDSLMLTAAQSNGLTYGWLMDGATIQDSISSTLIVDTTGTYQLVATNSCGTDTSTAIIVIMNPIPEAPVLTFVDSIIIASPANGPVQWYYNGSPIVDESDDTLHIVNIGSYSATVTDMNGCESPPGMIDVFDLALNESSGPVFSLSPNPTTGEFTILSESYAGEIVITSSDGRIVYRAIAEGNGKHTVDIGREMAGVYFVRLPDGPGEVVRITLVK